MSQFCIQSKSKLVFYGLITTLLFWLLVEIITRVVVSITTQSTDILLFGIQKADNQPQYQHIKDDNGTKLYYKLIPSQDIHNPVNSLGFRGPELLSKNSNTIRVLCLGSSTTYGLGLNYEDTYPKLLGDILNNNNHEKDLRFEVINAGMPAMVLPQITELVIYELAGLTPDIVIVMNIINNLQTKEHNFYSFFEIAGREQNVVLRWCRKLKYIFVKYSLLMTVTNNILKRGSRQYLRYFDYQGWAKELMLSEKNWEDYTINLKRLLDTIFSINPGCRVLLVEEPFNTLDYREFERPFAKALTILQDVSSTNPNIQLIRVATTIADAQKRGMNLWVAPYYDPMHLERNGNNILAKIVAHHLNP